MNVGDMAGKAFISTEINDRVFFSIVVVKELQANYTRVAFDKYLFEQGKGLIKMRTDFCHITVFNKFYKERLEHCHKAITVIFGGIGDPV